MYFKIKLSIALVFISIFSYGQLSVGGFPLQVNTLKSAVDNTVRMPELQQSIIDKAIKENQATDNLLKPFKFAHAFEVNLNPGNSGQWYSTNAKYNVWKLTIESSDAKSLNLIFNQFKLQDGTRLFIYSEEENQYLGAFTNQNNKASGKFAVAPVAGDKITVQYEVPEKMGTPDDFEITRVNHDFIGILKYIRRPYNKQPIAGDCNVDVNCEIGDLWNEVKNAVCRLIVNGEEICSGTLVNNTAEDQKPYVLSASHCYDEWNYAETTVYTFNYESPYCAPLDGDPSHSLSGAIMKAQFDSLDFALVELDEMPPPDFRPYYAGWDQSGEIPDSSASIHHPVGDIKKIAFENHPVSISSFTNSRPKPEYLKQGFFNVSRWDEGVTEVGSSGCALFNGKKQLIGTLTGGAATCSSPVNDYFARFDMQWDYRSDSTKQLKCWLDPLNSGVTSLEGQNFNTDENYCAAFTNLNDADEHGNIVLKIGGESRGYWGGSNSAGITEIVERFVVPGNETLDGISFGVGKLVLNSSSKNSKITVNVYNGNSLPESKIYSKGVYIAGFAEDAMNFIGFDETVEPEDTFYVGFELSSINAEDTFAVYQSLREPTNSTNQFYFKQNSDWYNFQDANASGYAMVNVMELLACNVSVMTDTQVIDTPMNVWVYPNPTQSDLLLESDKAIDSESVSVYNMIGQEMNVGILKEDRYRVRLKFSGNRPGVYFVRFNYNNRFVTRKVSFVPW
uniref:T9SS type A sorting domain-containing protein n=1 Tax=uncultured Draconibacterium sp. TaxID=1573823 RepID=UPI0032172970